MRHRHLLLALALCAAAACSDSPRPAAAPSPAIPAAADAAPDGITLKMSPPDPATPADGAVVDTETPTLTLTPGQPKFAGANTSSVRYRFHLLTDDGRSVRDALVDGTSWTVPEELEYETTYRWRVRAEADGAIGTWSRVVAFRSPDDPGGLPRGPYPTNGPDVAAWVAMRWPEMLEGGTSMGRRTEQMEFLRDRMIEAGRCGGLDVAWNKKRGVGPHSHDALAWRIGNRVEVVDLALAFKDPSKPMRLHWNVTAGPPGYDRYTNKFRCRP